MSDFTFTFHGTIATLDLFTQAAYDWVAENVQVEDWQWLCRWPDKMYRLAVEPRYAETLREGLLEAGLTEE